MCLISIFYFNYSNVTKIRIKLGIARTVTSKKTGPINNCKGELHQFSDILLLFNALRICPTRHLGTLEGVGMSDLLLVKFKKEKEKDHECR